MHTYMHVLQLWFHTKDALQQAPDVNGAQFRLECSTVFTLQQRLSAAVDLLDCCRQDILIALC